MDFNQANAKYIKEHYLKGTRIELFEMTDPYSPVPDGTKGTVDFVDDTGTIFMKWDNGRTLALIPGEDSFRIIPNEPELSTLKLYMPLTATLYERDPYGSLNEYPTEIENRDLLPYIDNVLSLIHRFNVPEEKKRGLMNWYRNSDSINEKTLSAHPDIHLKNDTLMGVIECEIKGELSPEELKTLKDYLTGQMSDGWGESFEQQPIKTLDEELYISFWSSDKSWNMCTEQELDKQKINMEDAKQEELSMGNMSL